MCVELRDVPLIMEYLAVDLSSHFALPNMQMWHPLWIHLYGAVIPKTVRYDVFIDTCLASCSFFSSSHMSKRVLTFFKSFNIEVVYQDFRVGWL